MIVIKISEEIKSKEALKERTRRAWKMDISRPKVDDKLISVHNGKILGEYKVLGYGVDYVEKDRIAFEIEEVESDLVGKFIDYQTSNPATIVETLNFK